MRITIGKYAFLICVLLVWGCSSVRVIKKMEPRANVEYMGEGEQNQTIKDSIMKGDPIIVSYMGADSNLVYLMPAEWDSIGKESVATIKLDQVVVTGSRIRQVAERKGKILIDFMVAVPKEMQHNAWQVNVYPLLRRGRTAVDSLEAIQLTGSKFRARQHRDHAAYDRYLERIIPDSADFFDSFVDAKGFYRYLDRLKNQREELNIRLNSPGRNIDNLLMERFILFNKIKRRKDTVRQINLDEQQHLILLRKQTAAGTATPYTQPANGLDSPLPTTGFANFNERYAHFRERVTHDFKDPLQQPNRGPLGAWLPRAMLYERDTTGLRVKIDAYNLRQRLMIESQLRDIATQDSSDVVDNFVKKRKIALNEKLKDEKDEVRNKMIPFALRDGLRLDTVISTRDTLYYKYSQQVALTESVSKLYVYLNGDLVSRNGVFYQMPASDTLTFNVSSMTKFIDETPYYVNRIVSRDAKANSSFFVEFPKSKSVLNENYESNREELQKVKEMISKLMKDPIYIIDSVSVCAYSSPEGSYTINKRLSEERSQAFGQFMESELKSWEDSLRIEGSIVLDNEGRARKADEVQQQYPDLGKSLRIRSVAENWEKLTNLIASDEKIKNRQKILNIIETVSNQDQRENAIRGAFPGEYTYIRNQHYPALRVVDIEFNLHRRGMVKDTIHTTDLDSVYMEGVRLLKAHQYTQAIEILKPYDNVNTAIAYMSLGYDDAALRIFAKVVPTAEVFYAMAILYARKNDPSKAIEQLMRAIEMNPSLRFRANLDPELSELVRMYNLFSEDDF